MFPAEIIERAGLKGHSRVVLGAKSGDTGVAISENPATGEPIAGIRLDDAASYEKTVSQSVETFKAWRLVPAPVRGQIVRAIGDELRRHKDALGALVSLEVGKILAEGLGEVQETIDIADYAVGLSRNLGGPVLSSERPEHAMYENWHPLGPIGVITAFNFPNAVWGWNAMLAAVCGDVTIWKPSLFAPLTAIATNDICERVAKSMGHPGIFRLVIGSDVEVGERLVADKRIPLISATGSTRMGKRVGQVVAGRVGRTLLELGGNNGLIVTPSADLELALKSVVFGSVGTAGQRCTTTRRLIIHESIADGFVSKLVAAYKTVRIGDPLAEGTLMGPLINAKAVETFLGAVATAREQGGRVLAGGERHAATGLLSKGHYVQPTIIRARTNNTLPIAMEETFAPILYVFTYRDLDQALAIHNSVDAGLASAIFTNDVRESQRFVSPTGSDCGLAYVNLGTSGAEIGGAFGGEKDTGGGRESGSDSWKAYMRRQTCTINFGREFKLAQGIRFE
jgi:aldehyde dehydrogenase (NAD+)